MKRRLLLLSLIPVLSSCGGNSLEEISSSFSSIPVLSSSGENSLEEISSSSSNPIERIEMNALYRKIDNDKIASLDEGVSSRLGLTSLRSLESRFDAKKGNLSLSPASFILASAGLAAVSSNFPNEEFGLVDAASDCKELMEAWNFHFYEKSKDRGERSCAFEAAILHQQVGRTYEFDKAKQEAVLPSYVSTMASDLSSYHQEAEAFFHDILGYSLPVPEAGLTRDGVITYGGFKMKDFVPGGLGEQDAPFKGKDVPSYSFGSVYHPEYLSYCKGSNYEAFRLKVFYTDLVLVLPSEGVDIHDVSLSSAYEEFKNNSNIRMAMGYLPYFHIQTLEENLTSIYTSKMKGDEIFYDSLLKDDVYNDLTIASVLQSNDFEFNQFGIAGESITMIVTSGAAMPEEHEVITLNVDRPFYAISEKDGFPLFANRVETIE